jgi:hypothetical protein
MRRAAATLLRARIVAAFDAGSEDVFAALADAARSAWGSGDHRVPHRAARESGLMGCNSIIT